jgi:hypothetical protein
MAKRRTSTQRRRSRSENIMLVVGILVALSMVIGGLSVFLR